MYLPRIWRDWQEIRKLWWVQVLYIGFLLGSYAILGYVLSCIWLLSTPSLLQLFLITLGTLLGTFAVAMSILDGILLCCRRSARVQTMVVEPIVVPVSFPQSNPMLVPRKPIGRGSATAEKIETPAVEPRKETQAVEP